MCTPSAIFNLVQIDRQWLGIKTWTDSVSSISVSVSVLAAQIRRRKIEAA